MKKYIALMLALVLLFCVGCGKKTGDIPMEKLQWYLNEGQLDDGDYVFVNFGNNSQYTFTSVQLNFEIREDVDAHKVTEIYIAIQESQGFTDQFMQEYKRNLEDNGKRLSMQARIDQPLTPGQEAREIKCYYMGGWTSKDVLFAEYFELTTIVIGYEKDGVAYTQTYDKAAGTYICAEAAVQQ